MRKLYTQLANAFWNKEYKINKTEYTNIQDFSHFVSMKGKYFDEQTCRLMIIGRAVNGWLKIPGCTPDEFGLNAEREFLKSGFGWVVYDGKGLHNVPEKPDETYYLSRSPFWRTAKQIWEGLSGASQDRWVDYIAWSNIYKIAPPVTGNPTTKMCREQIQICREILRKEIDAYCPTHILFATGWNWWFDDAYFGASELFEDRKYIGENKRNNTLYVEGVAVYNGIHGKVPVIVACRPEQRNEYEYASQVIRYFEKYFDCGRIV